MHSAGKMSAGPVSVLLLLAFSYTWDGCHSGRCDQFGSKVDENNFHEDSRYLPAEPGTYTQNSTGRLCKMAPKCKCSLTVFDQIHVRCTGLTEIPRGLPNNTRYLIMRGNNITDIPDNIFINLTKLVILYLDNNSITELRPAAFNGLTNLETLWLHGNRIRYTDTAIQVGVFSPLKKMTTLFMRQSLKHTKPEEEYPSKALKDLTALENLYIDGLPGKHFDKYFSEMKGLTKLCLWGVHDSRCEVNNIEQGMFKHLSQIKILSIRNCKVLNIENGSFSELHNLEVLDLSLNTALEFKSMANMTYGLRRDIHLLNLTSIHTMFGDCTRLTRDNLRYLRKSRIKSLILDSNRLAFVTFSAVDFIPSGILCLSLKDNMMLLGPYLIKIFLGNVFKNLEVTILSEQRETHSINLLFHSYRVEAVRERLGNNNQRGKAGFNNIISESGISNDTTRRTSGGNTDIKHKKDYHTESDGMRNEVTVPNKETDITERNFEENLKSHEMGTMGNSIIMNKILRINGEELESAEQYCSNCRSHKAYQHLPLPSKIHSLDLSDMKVRFELNTAFCLCEPNRLEVLLMNRNVYWNWQGPFVGFYNLTQLNMAWNSCENISFTAFHHMPNLDLLNVSKNFLGFSLSADVNGDTFRKQAVLRTLDLSENKLRTLPPKIFEGLEKLELLYMQNNLMTQINMNMENMVKLKMIDFSNNLLEEVSEPARNHFDFLAKNIFSINLSNNKFICNCKHLEFIKWISNTKVLFVGFKTYQCKYDNGSIGNLTAAAQMYSDLRRECSNHLVLILITTSVLMFVILLIVVGLLYRYRWDLRYMYYSAKFRLMGYKPVNSEGEGDFDYDVFVSYADGDRGFVRQHVVSELEEKRQLRLLVHDRDFLAGSFVCENIMTAITISRKTLIIMSNSFLKSHWCRYEMNMARMEGIKTGRNVVCVLLLEEVSHAGLPLEIIDIIREQTYADIPTNPEHQVQFWDRLKTALVM